MYLFFLYPFRIVGWWRTGQVSPSGGGGGRARPSPCGAQTNISARGRAQRVPHLIVVHFWSRRADRRRRRRRRRPSSSIRPFGGTFVAGPVIYMQPSSRTHTKHIRRQHWLSSGTERVSGMLSEPRVSGLIAGRRTVATVSYCERVTGYCRGPPPT